jgi:hypothetical protein
VERVGSRGENVKLGWIEHGTGRLVGSRFVLTITNINGKKN